MVVDTCHDSVEYRRNTFHMAVYCLRVKGRRERNWTASIRAAAGYFAVDLYGLNTRLALPLHLAPNQSARHPGLWLEARRLVSA